jgi:CDP-diacylglycerol--serine O-phosphatidyltransferase
LTFPTKQRTLLAIVTACTSFNLLMGMAALFLSGLGRTREAAWCLLFSVLLDAVDGSLARLWNVSSEFGAQLDSLADMTSFNIAGAVLCFYWFSPGLPPLWIAAAAGLSAVTGACRLARFNSGSKVEGEFEGMPTTAMATLVAATYLTCPQLNCQWGLFLVVTLSLLMVSGYPYPKITRIARYPWQFWAVLGVGGLLCLHWTVWACAIAYVLSGPSVWLRRKLG